MDKNQDTDFGSKLRHFLHPINIYKNLKSLYFAIIPKDSKLYIFTYGILLVFLKKLDPLNIYYQEWIRRFDTLSEQDHAEIRNQIHAMTLQPAFSVVMPVYNPPPDLLEEAIQSVLDQVYPHWEFCIADDASTDQKVIAILNHYDEGDERIRVVFREENGHIAAASNSALELVSNDYFALLDHDDRLHPLALFHVAQTVENNPDAVIIYSDEDKITKRGKRLDPYFKPDYNYELLLSQNMISHLGVYRTEIVRRLGGFRVGLEGSQDYDLALRVIEKCQPSQIHHIPKPLYHWRIFKDSAARDMNIKPYAIKSGIQALSGHFQRQSIKAHIQFLPELAGYSVYYDPQAEKPEVDLILQVDQIDPELKTFFQEVFNNTDYPNYQIILCSGNEMEAHKSDPTWLEDPRIKLMPFGHNPEHSFAQRVNSCLAVSQGEVICLLDKNMSSFKPGWLTDLVGQTLQPDIGAVAPRLIYQPTGGITQKERVFSNGIVLLPDQKAYHLFKGQERTDTGYFGWGKLTRGYSALSEKCLIFKRSDCHQVGGFDETLPLPFYTSIDFCLKLRSLGCRNILRPSVELYIQAESHYNNRLTAENHPALTDLAELQKRWKVWFNQDPAFNPNLTIVDENKLLVDLSTQAESLGEL